jgi:hypothetical protein
MAAFPPIAEIQTGHFLSGSATMVQQDLSLHLSVVLKGLTDAPTATRRPATSSAGCGAAQASIVVRRGQMEGSKSLARRFIASAGRCASRAFIEASPKRSQPRMLPEGS